MITALIFFAHLLFITVVFTKKWQSDSLTSAFVNAALIILLFSVGWSISTMITKLVIGPKGFGLYLDRDAFSLLILSVAEYFFYRIYYNEKAPGNENEDLTEDEKETQL